MPHNILWAPMVDLTVSAVMAGLTNVLWAPMAGPTFSCGRQMAGPTDIYHSSVGAKWMAPPSTVGADDCPHRGYPHLPQSIVLSTPTYLLRVRSVRRPEFPVRIGGGGGWCLNHLPFTHCRLRRYFPLYFRHVRHQISRCSESLSSDVCDVRPCPSIPFGIPVLRRHQIFSCSYSWPL